MSMNPITISPPVVPPMSKSEMAARALAPGRLE